MAMRKEEARRRALQSVLRITFTLGVAGCTEDATTPQFEIEPDAERSVGDAALGGEAPDRGAPGAPDDRRLDTAPALHADAATDAPDAAEIDATADHPDAAEIDALAGADGQADRADALAAGDATAGGDAMVCPSPNEDQAAWQRCCESVNWDPSKVASCLAWGPAVPPRFRRIA